MNNVLIVCYKCKVQQSRFNFYNRLDAKTKRDYICKPCRKEYQAKRNKELPRYGRNNYLERVYGISLEKYDFLFRSQNGNCAMCQRKSERNLSVDHDHVTGKVRGLLCVSCNALLGFAQEDLRILQEAVKYLKSSRLSEPSEKTGDHAISLEV